MSGKEDECFTFATHDYARCSLPAVRLGRSCNEFGFHSTSIPEVFAPRVCKL